MFRDSINDDSFALSFWTKVGFFIYKVTLPFAILLLITKIMFYLVVFIYVYIPTKPHPSVLWIDPRFLVIHGEKVSNFLLLPKWIMSKY